MTEYQRDRCASIIKNAADAALVAGSIPIPVPGVDGAMPFQIKMVMELADVFDVSMSTSRAASIVTNYFTSGSSILGFLARRLPVIRGFKAAEQTEDFGWKVARDFDRG